MSGSPCFLVPVTAAIVVAVLATGTESVPALAAGLAAGVTLTILVVLSIGTATSWPATGVTVASEVLATRTSAGVALIAAILTANNASTDDHSSVTVSISVAVAIAAGPATGVATGSEVLTAGAAIRVTTGTQVLATRTTIGVTAGTQVLATWTSTGVAAGTEVLTTGTTVRIATRSQILTARTSARVAAVAIAVSVARTTVGIAIRSQVLATRAAGTAAIISIALVADLRPVTLLIGFVLHDLQERKREGLGAGSWTKNSGWWVDPLLLPAVPRRAAYLLPSVGQQDIVLAGGEVTVAHL